MEMRLVEAPAVRPFLCIDGTQTGPVVDTLITHPAYGRMYWPRHMVHSAGRLFGMVSPEDHAVVAAEAETLRAKVADLEGELAELEPVQRALRAAADRFRDVEQVTFTAEEERPVRRRKPAA